MNFGSGRAAAPPRLASPCPIHYARCLRPQCEPALWIQATFCHYPQQSGRKTRDRGVAMRTFSRAAQSLPLLTSRRHVDLHRTASAICRPV
ncbi:putative leader peptide [Streptomyces massasporeus]